MNMTEIDNALRQLRLSGMQQTLSTRAMQAQASQEPFLETFAALLQDELERRRSVLLDRRYKRSGLDEKTSLADLDWRINPKIPRAACFELHTLKFIAQGANALIVGRPGTGKSHVLHCAGKYIRMRAAQLGLADPLRVSALSGAAATQVYGATLHSLFGILVGTPFDEVPGGDKETELQKRHRDAAFEFLDERSMLSLTLFGQIISRHRYIWPDYK